MSWQDHVRRVTPYVPGEQPRQANIIKLNTNENPYPPCPGVREVLRALPSEQLRKYPDPAASALVHALSVRYQVPEDQIFVGVGSDDVLAMSFLTFFGSHQPILFPDITYSFYDVWAEVFRIPFERLPLDADFRIRTQDYHRPNGGIVIANPNAPTGEVLSLEEIEEIVHSNPDVVVIIDEAYVDFGGDSALPLIGRYDNVLVVQTFSKSRSMAGMRIGYAFGSKALIRALSDVRYSFNSYTMNLPSIEAGCAALADEAYFQETVARIVATREWTRQQLLDLGFVCGPSRANFLFVSHPVLSARELFGKLREAGIIVRYFDRPRIDRYLRITIGTDEEMEQLVAFFREQVKKL